MTDLVDYIEEKSNNFAWRFSYGNRANQNLIESDLIEDRVYLLLDPIRRIKNFSEYGATTSVSFTGRFLLMVKSNLDNSYYNQDETELYYNRILALNGGFIVNNNCIDEKVKLGKYNKNIKPLLTEVIKLEEELNCSNFQVNNWQVTDAINFFDANLDGIIVEFNLLEDYA